MIPIQRPSPVYRAGQDTGRILLTPPPPRARPQARTMAPRTPGLSSPQGPQPSPGTQLTAGRTYSAPTKRHLAMSARKCSRFLLDHLCRANTRPIQPGSHPQATGSQWDHSCSENRAHARVVPLAAARADTAVCFQPQSFQHLHVIHLPRGPQDSCKHK